MSQAVSNAFQEFKQTILCWQAEEVQYDYAICKRERKREQRKRKRERET